MNNVSKFLFLSLVCFNTPLVFSQDIPSKYIELLDYVQEAPDQGETNSCLFVASTGAMELLANRKYGVKNPRPYGRFDLSESFLMHAPNVGSSKYFWEEPVLKFNKGYGIHIDAWPYDGWDGTEIGRVWSYRDWSTMPKVELPKVETIPLFVKGGRWSTNVLTNSHVDQIKEALWKHKSPVLVNYNDSGFWHVILIVGYDDKIPGDCYEVTAEECAGRQGAFYVRDSFGRVVEVRDYDWFRVKGNAAFVVKEK